MGCRWWFVWSFHLPPLRFLERILVLAATFPLLAWLVSPRLSLPRASIRSWCSLALFRRARLLLSVGLLLSTALRWAHPPKTTPFRIFRLQSSRLFLRFCRRREATARLLCRVVYVMELHCVVGLLIAIATQGLGSGADITAVYFGNATATVVSQTESSVVVTVPAAQASTVVVAVESTSRGLIRTGTTAFTFSVPTASCALLFVLYIGT